MNCPLCSHDNTKVNDSRSSQDGLSIRRRRECVKCGYRFSTLEETEILDMTIIKRDGRRENYDKDKLTRGLERALEKRQYQREAFHSLVQQIERDIQKLKKSEITTEQIGQIVMDNLKQFDQVAYIRFASVYRAFTDASSFAKELKHLDR